MRKHTKIAIEKHAIECYPKESCGVIITVGRREKYVPIRNQATGNDSFLMDHHELAAAEDEGTITAYVHSHPNDVKGATESDRVSCSELGLPWYIVEVMTNGQEPQILRILTLEPDEYNAPLIGRSFFHGKLDCYSLIRDWYQRERGVTLPDFERADQWWKNSEQELYLDNFEAAGFRRLKDREPLEVGDVILMQHNSARTNHGGVYIDNTMPIEHQQDRHHSMRGMMLHHLYGRPSERVVYGGYWQDVTRARLRFVGDEK